MQRLQSRVQHQSSEQEQAQIEFNLQTLAQSPASQFRLKHHSPASDSVQSSSPATQLFFDDDDVDVGFLVASSFLLFPKCVAVPIQTLRMQRIRSKKCEEEQQVGVGE